MSPPTGSIRTRSTRCARSFAAWARQRRSFSRRTSSRRSRRRAPGRSSSTAAASSPTARRRSSRRAPRAAGLRTSSARSRARISLRRQRYEKTRSGPSGSGGKGPLGAARSIEGSRCLSLRGAGTASAAGRSYRLRGGGMTGRWAAISTVAKRELAAYFESPVAYVFLVIFLLLAGFFTFTFGGFFERGEASLAAFFNWLPWLFLFLVPAAGMRLW